MSKRFTWAKAEADFRRRVEYAIKEAMHGACMDSIGPGSRGERAAQMASESLWSVERIRIEREREAQRAVAKVRRDFEA